VIQGDGAKKCLYELQVLRTAYESGVQNTEYWSCQAPRMNGIPKVLHIPYLILSGRGIRDLLGCMQVTGSQVSLREFQDLAWLISTTQCEVRSITPYSLRSLPVRRMLARVFGLLQQGRFGEAKASQHSVGLASANVPWPPNETPRTRAF